MYPDVNKVIILDFGTSCKRTIINAKENADFSAVNSVGVYFCEIEEIVSVFFINDIKISIQFLKIS